MQNPRIRPLDFQAVVYEEQQMWLLRDPQELSEYQLIMSPTLAQLLLFCDGTRSIQEIQVAFLDTFGVAIDLSTIQDALEQLDRACLLDNDRSERALGDRLVAFRSQPYRQPALAGVGYPTNPTELANALAAFGQDVSNDDWQSWTGRGVVSPHIDYQRGGPVYAQVWQRAREAVKEADLVLIFGTDHFGGEGSITLTRQCYATPFGIMPTDLNLVDALAEVIGPDAFAYELNHEKEHSVELSAVWLHYMRGQDTCPMLPILCGSFQHFVMNGHHPAEDRRLTTFIETLRQKTAGKRVLAVASVDLAHVGPSFGDDFIMDSSRRAALIESDRSLMEAISLGDAARFYREVAAVEDRNRICGFSSIYLMLRFLDSAKGIKIAYQHCPADALDTSLVSICGLLLD